MFVLDHNIKPLANPVLRPAEANTEATQPSTLTSALTLTQFIATQHRPLQCNLFMFDQAVHLRAKLSPVESFFAWQMYFQGTPIKPTLSECDTVCCASQDCQCFSFTELTIKQEEETAEETDNRSPALEEIGQTEEEGEALDESMTGSPDNIQDGLSGPNVTADAGSRQPNGTNEYISKFY